MGAPSLDLRKFGPISAAVRTSLRGGRRTLTIIAKGALTFAPGSPPALAPPAPIVFEDQHLRGNPIASLVRGSDVGLCLPQAEVVVIATAFAPGGQSTQLLLVGFDVIRGHATLISKRLRVVGDGASGAPRAPFTQIPLVYERARGGMASRRNPVGVGDEGSSRGPNIAYPDQDEAGRGNEREYPTGLGPMPSAWTVRRRFRGALSPHDAFADHEVELPQDFDDAYYQAAPNDQRLESLISGDKLVFFHLHAVHERLELVLPEMAVRGAVEAGALRLDVPMRLECLHVEPALLSVDLVFRGSVELTSDVTEACVGVGMVLGKSIELPPLQAGVPEPSRSSASGPTLAAGGTQILEVAGEAISSSTVVLEPERDAPSSLPFIRRSPRSTPRKETAAAAPPGSPWNTQQGPAAVRVDTPRSDTLLVEPPISPSAEGQAATAAGREPVLGVPYGAERPSPWREDPSPPLAPPPPKKPEPVPRADVQSILNRRTKR